jgi:PHP family Zn ribbon phosphoesterase
MTALLADLHIHTALSPCASRQMLPRGIVCTAREKGLKMVAICDHNSAANVSAVVEAADRETNGALKVIPGIEVTTREEVHVLGLFPALGGALAVAEKILDSLPRRKPAGPAADPPGKDPGCQQWILDAQDRQTGTEQRILAAASRYSLLETVELIRRNGGIAVAAHVDRRAFSVLGQLGFFPETPQFSAAEISTAGAASGRMDEFRQYGLPLISSSDSHFLADIGRSCMTLLVVEPCFAELVLAIQGIGSRRCQIA